MIDKCENCKFWESDDDVQGICLRHAPSPVAPYLVVHDPVATYLVVHDLVTDARPWAVWPLTAHLDGCGEFDFKPIRGRPQKGPV